MPFIAGALQTGKGRRLRTRGGGCSFGVNLLMDKSRENDGCKANVTCFLASFVKKGAVERPAISGSPNRRITLGIVLVAFTCAMLVGGCGEEPSSKSASNEQAKPAAPVVPEEIQSAAESLLGKETQVLVFGDLAKIGKQQFLAGNVVPKTPKNDAPGTIVTRAVIAENNDGKWSEVLRCDEHLKNTRGYLALTPLAGVNGWKVQYEQDPVKGIQIYLTPIKVAGETHVVPIGIAWNPATKRYQSLDRTYEHFLLESQSLQTPRSTLR